MPIYFKACPKCQGDVVDFSDMYGAYWDCLQCGYQPISMRANDSERNGKLISLDRHIEDLWLLTDRGHISPSSTDHGRNAEALEKRLHGMGKYDYVYVSDEGQKTDKNSNNYEITLKGRIVVNGYKSLIRRIKKHERSNENGGAIIGSYELVDEDGNLTLFGTYAIQASTILSEFIDNIYPMATIALEGREPPQEKSGEERQPVLTKSL